MKDKMKDKIVTIMAKCVELTEAGKGHFFCRYSGHVNWIEVDAYPVGFDYQDGNHDDRIIAETVWIDNEDGQEKLDELIKMLEGFE